MQDWDGPLVAAHSRRACACAHPYVCTTLSEALAGIGYTSVVLGRVWLCFRPRWMWVVRAVRRALWTRMRACMSRRARQGELDGAVKAAVRRVRAGVGRLLSRVRAWWCRERYASARREGHSERTAPPRVEYAWRNRSVRSVRLQRSTIARRIL